MTKSESVQPFVFYTETRLVELTGLTAGNLREFLHLMKTVSGSSIFYHTHQFFLERHFVESGFFNDFASWVYNELREFELGERLNYIDFAALKSVRETRNTMTDLIETHIAEKEFLRQAATEKHFHFCMSKSFAFPTGHVASSLSEFIQGIQRGSADSIFYHFIESRLRVYTESFGNDFSIWLANQYGLDDLADELQNIDPYFQSLETVRERILELLGRAE